ncbi:hypothetical protein ACO2Q3_00330 [Caulobacter sp. KR2-114]|uniref:hypothetical protein n=1 Tax=Caulobacter sp. KR2-114 TaxID=3400912 RepID=UPI003C01C4EA
MSRLAEALGVDRSTVSRWFAGLPVPGPVAAAVNAWLRLQAVTGERPEAGQGAPAEPAPAIWRARVAAVDGPPAVETAWLRRSPAGRLVSWNGRVLQALAGEDPAATHFDVETGRRYRITDALTDDGHDAD